MRSPAKDPVTLLDGHSLTPANLLQIAEGGRVGLDAEGLATMGAARAVVERAVSERRPVYGVTTGLGPKVTATIPSGSMDSFSVNTIRGRAHGVGAPLDSRWVRSGMAVRANTLLLGAAGARPELAHLLVDCLNASITPVIPESGTIGVADLPWGAALGLCMMGEGQMTLPDATIVGSAEALQSADLHPYEPQPREGLALVSHSTLTAGLAALGFAQLIRCFESAQTAAAFSLEGFRANLSPLDQRLLALRPQPGQAEAADGLRRRLEGSSLFKPGAARRLQDPLSLRNIAQVHGSVRAVLDTTLIALDAELNGASDNPGVLVESGEILSHGGYLPSYLCLALNSTQQSLVHLAALQVSRISKMLFERFTDLPDGLSPAGAEGAGFSPVMKTTETLFAEIAHLAAPSPIYPGLSADGLEDVVTHAAIPAKAMFPMAVRLRQLAAIEAIVAIHAIDLRKLADDLTPTMRPVYDSIKAVSKPLTVDRPLGLEIDQVAGLIALGDFEI